MTYTVTHLIAALTDLRRLLEHIDVDPDVRSDEFEVADRLAKLEHQNELLRHLAIDTDDVDHFNHATASASEAAQAVQDLHDLVSMAALASSSEFLDSFELPQKTDNRVWEHAEWVVGEVTEDSLASLEAALARKLAIQVLERDPSKIDSEGRVHGFLPSYLKSTTKPSDWCREYCQDIAEIIATCTDDDKLDEDLATLIRQASLASSFTLVEFRALVAEIIRGEMGALEPSDLQCAVDDLADWLGDFQELDESDPISTEVLIEARRVLVRARELACRSTAYSALAASLARFETPTVSKARTMETSRGERATKIPATRQE